MMRTRRAGEQHTKPASAPPPPPPPPRAAPCLAAAARVPHSSTAPPAQPNWFCNACIHPLAPCGLPAAAALHLSPLAPHLAARPLRPASRRILLLLVAARFTFNALLRGPTQRLAERRGAGKGHRDGSRLLEEIYVTLGNVAMLAGALFVMLYR